MRFYFIDFLINRMRKAVFQTIAFLFQQHFQSISRCYSWLCLLGLVRLCQVRISQNRYNLWPKLEANTWEERKDKRISFTRSLFLSFYHIYFYLFHPQTVLILISPISFLSCLSVISSLSINYSFSFQLFHIPFLSLSPTPFFYLTYPFRISVHLCISFFPFSLFLFVHLQDQIEASLSISQHSCLPNYSNCDVIVQRWPRS